MHQSMQWPKLVVRMLSCIAPQHANCDVESFQWNLPLPIKTSMRRLLVGIRTAMGTKQSSSSPFLIWGPVLFKFFLKVELIGYVYRIL